MIHTKRQEIIRQLPDTYLETIVHDSTMIIDGHIVKKGSDFSYEGKKNVLVEGDNKFNLHILESFAKLEDKYQKDNVEKVSEVQRELLDVANKEELSDLDLKSMRTSLNLKIYLLEKILPSYGVSDPLLVSQAKTILQHREDLSRKKKVDDSIFQEEYQEMSFSSSSGNKLFEMLSSKKKPSTSWLSKKKPKKLSEMMKVEQKKKMLCKYPGVLIGDLY